MGWRSASRGYPSGSFAKGTANRSGTDIDLFISLTSGTPDTLKEIYTKALQSAEGEGLHAQTAERLD